MFEQRLSDEELAMERYKVYSLQRESQCNDMRVGLNVVCSKNSKKASLAGIG